MTYNDVLKIVGDMYGSLSSLGKWGVIVASVLSALFVAGFAYLRYKQGKEKEKIAEENMTKNENINTSIMRKENENISEESRDAETKINEKIERLKNERNEKLQN